MFVLQRWMQDHHLLSLIMGVQDWQKPDLNVCTVSSVPVRPVRGSSKTNEMTGNNRKESQRGIPADL